MTVALMKEQSPPNEALMDGLEAKDMALQGAAGMATGAETTGLFGLQHMGPQRQASADFSYGGPGPENDSLSPPRHAPDGHVQA